MNLTARRSVLPLALLGALIGAAPAGAETFTVNTPDDAPGPTGCPALCSVRAALGAAAGNAAGTDDVVEVPAGTFTLNAQLAVPAGQTRITIRGAGANSTSIQPQAAAAIRVLLVNAGAAITLTDLTLRGGNVAAGAGGNLSIADGGAATLQRARVTGGSAPQGGGIAITGGGSPATNLSVSQSLIDGNTASGAAITAAGGGVYVSGTTIPATVTIQDSTITGNSARNGAGISVTGNGQQPPTLRGVTVARNNARAGTPPGAGGIAADSTIRLQGSIVAGNTTTINLGPGPVQQPFNCSIAPAATDQGGNVETGNDCGLAASAHQNTDPQLAAALDTSQPPVLAIPANSPAVDVADCAGRTFDQRGVARPQLSGCDAGAYEYQVPPPDPTPIPTPTPAPPTATPTPTATPVPTPVVNQTVVVRRARGTVRIKRRGSNRYVTLSGADGIPVGSTVDTRKGAVVLTSIPKAGAPPESATFYDGIFRVTQSRGITTLTLSEQLAPCSSKRARASAKKPKTRKLWGDGKGKFRTKGQYSAATIRGTKWLVQDGCRFTKTRVTQGTVLVRDEVKKKNIVLRKGKSYTARPRR